MVVIRLARSGAKKRPFYHVVATEQKNARDGRYIERLGYFNPIARGQEARLHLDLARVDHWISVGAQPSDRTKKLIADFRKNPEKAAEPKAHKVKPAKPVVEAVKEEAETSAQATEEQASSEE